MGVDGDKDIPLIATLALATMSNAVGNNDEDTDCPLCLLPLETYDHSHPIQCPSRHCHFNCCMDCLENMIKASKDDHTEASDGNTFRVFLHCPNCRSNLGPSIRDTVLLRKVEKYRPNKYADNGHGVVEVIDDGLSASELRFKYALEKDEAIASAIEGALHREDDFFGKGAEIGEESSDDYFLGSPGGSLGGKESIWSFDDEEGFEADLSGPHRSFIFQHHSMLGLGNTFDEPIELEDITPDSTLLCGLDAFMTDQEQQFMTAQLISGDKSRLAAATEMMHYVSALSREGMRPSLKRRQSSMGRKKSMLEIIKEVIREGNEARRLEDERGARNVVGVMASQLNAAARTVRFGGLEDEKRNQKMLVDKEMKRQMEYMKLHPLPLRMPKYAEATASKSVHFGMSFLDDTWNGTVLDAFSKITVNKSLLGHTTIIKQHAESSGIHRVIDAGSPKFPRSNGRGCIDTEKPRVLVASINREMGRQGVVKGDVVTHFNGEEFLGTASELTDLILIGNRYEGEVLTFVLNADAAVAEALKRRSMISDDH